MSVSSGTSALFLAVKVLNLKKNDEVILSSNTNIATALAAYHNNLKVILFQNGGIRIDYPNQLFVKSLKKVMLVLFFVPNIFIFPHELTAESKGREIQNFVRSETTLQARKRKAYENAQKESGLRIKRYLINKSAIQSKKGKSAVATKKMVESGLVTLEMVKNNKSVSYTHLTLPTNREV